MIDQSGCVVEITHTWDRLSMLKLIYSARAGLQRTITKCRYIVACYWINRIANKAQHNHLTPHTYTNHPTSISR